MTVLDSFGFKIFRLREVKDSDEFLLFDKVRRTFNQYNEKRLLKVLDCELYNKGINYKQIAIDKLNYDERVKPESLLREWSYHELKLIDNLGYKPMNEMIFEENNKFLFNMYSVSELSSKKDYADKDWNLIKELIMNLVSNNKNEFHYFTCWLAWQIKNPLRRLPTSIILQGEQGTGKTKFCELVLKNIFDRNFCEIGQADINKEYNDFIVGKQLIVANEVIHNDNKFLVPDKLKNYVTDEYLSINRKFKDTIYVKNYSQWIFVTNNDMPLKIDKDDRRYSIFKSKKLKDGFKLIKELLNDLDNQLEGFIYYLNNLDIEYEFVATPLMNDAKEDLIKLSQNSVEEFVEHIKEIGGIDSFSKEYNSNVSFTDSPKGICVLTDVFYELYLKYCNRSGIKHIFTRRNFTSQLKKIGFIADVVKIDEKATRVILLSGVD